MPSTISYLDRLTRARNVEDLWDMHCRKMAEFGFDRLIYGFTRYRTPNSLGDPEDFIVLTNHAPAYTEVFMGQGLYFHAPMTHWALENEGACSWRILAQKLAGGEISPQQLRVMNFNVTHKVLAGYTISFKSLSPRIRGAIALTARPGLSQDDVDAIWAENGEDILVMNNIAHLKIMSLPHFTPGRGLTKRQREALQWVGDGKTTQDIAILMGLTPATVEKHLRLAREALAVETTAQAVLKAAFQNQMFVLEA